VTELATEGRSLLKDGARELRAEAMSPVSECVCRCMAGEGDGWAQGARCWVLGASVRCAVCLGGQSQRCGRCREAMGTTRKTDAYRNVVLAAHTRRRGGGFSG
jgi:hypothetical protein